MCLQGGTRQNQGTSWVSGMKGQVSPLREMLGCWDGVLATVELKTLLGMYFHLNRELLRFLSKKQVLNNTLPDDITCFFHYLLG